MFMIIFTNAFWEGHIESLKLIFFNCSPKFRVMLSTFSLNLSESQCEERIGFQNRLSLAITQQDQRHISATRESTSNTRVPVCQHLSLSGLCYLLSRFPFQTYTSSQSWPCWVRPLMQSSSLHHGEFILRFSVMSNSFLLYSQKNDLFCSFGSIDGGIMFTKKMLHCKEHGQTFARSWTKWLLLNLFGVQNSIQKWDWNWDSQAILSSS